PVGLLAKRLALQPGPEGAQQRFLGGEVAIDRALADASVAGDFGKVQILERPAFELIAYGAQDLFAGLLTLAVPKVRQGGFHDSRTVMGSSGKSTHAAVTPQCSNVDDPAPNRRTLRVQCALWPRMIW